MKQRIRQTLLPVRILAAGLLSWLASAGLWMAASGLGGVGLVVTGVFLLAGIAWACIIAGIFLILFAGLIFRGLTSG
ncbi:MAG TPA: hypothetical protein VL027_12560 [Spongiibacteraceae bacterium]|nr:hypothetical protein [Spongiibacteraceae bacterium]